MGFDNTWTPLIGVVFLTSACLIVGHPAADEYNNEVNNDGRNKQYAGASSGAAAGIGGIPQFPQPPYPQFPQFEYERLFRNYFDQLQQYHKELIDYNGVGGGRGQSSAIGASAMFYDNDRPRSNVNANSFAYFPTNGYSTAKQTYDQAHTYAQNVPNVPGYGASAGANVDTLSQTVHQQANLYPPNPNDPNVKVENRFVDHQLPPNTHRYGVFVSSAGASGVGPDGKPFQYRAATTTVDNNGNVTTYTVKDP